MASRRRRAKGQVNEKLDEELRDSSLAFLLVTVTEACVCIVSFIVFCFTFFSAALPSLVAVELAGVGGRSWLYVILLGIFAHTILVHNHKTSSRRPRQALQAHYIFVLCTWLLVIVEQHQRSTFVKGGPCFVETLSVCGAAGIQSDFCVDDENGLGRVRGEGDYERTVKRWFRSLLSLYEIACMSLLLRAMYNVLRNKTVALHHPAPKSLKRSSGSAEKNDVPYFDDGDDDNDGSGQRKEDIPQSLAASTLPFVAISSSPIAPDNTSDDTVQQLDADASATIGVDDGEDVEIRSAANHATVGGRDSPTVNTAQHSIRGLTRHQESVLVERAKKKRFSLRAKSATKRMNFTMPKVEMVSEREQRASFKKLADKLLFIVGVLQIAYFHSLFETLTVSRLNKLWTEKFRAWQDAYGADGAPPTYLNSSVLSCENFVVEKWCEPVSDTEFGLPPRVLDVEYFVEASSEPIMKVRGSLVITMLIVCVSKISVLVAANDDDEEDETSCGAKNLALGSFNVYDLWAIVLTCVGTGISLIAWYADWQACTPVPGLKAVVLGTTAIFLRWSILHKAGNTLHIWGVSDIPLLQTFLVKWFGENVVDKFRTSSRFSMSSNSPVLQRTKAAAPKQYYPPLEEVDDAAGSRNLEEGMVVAPRASVQLTASMKETWHEQRENGGQSPPLNTSTPRHRLSQQQRQPGDNRQHFASPALTKPSETLVTAIPTHASVTAAGRTSGNRAANFRF